MLSNAWRIGSIRGIDIRIHSSWIIIALLVAWSFWARFGTVLGFSVATGIVMAVVATLLFFASVLAHEIAHSLEAQHRGVQVGGITLFLFGGVTETRFDVKRPRDEFALTAIGPFTSIVLAAAFGIIAAFAGVVRLGSVGAVAGTLAWVNFALGVFNLLPGAPLDGGRILRSAVWWITGDRAKSVRVASRSGQVIGGLMAAVGIFFVFFVPGAIVAGIWWAFIGWFLASAAGQELAQHETQDLVEGRTVADFLDTMRPGVAADATVSDAAGYLTRVPEDVISVADDGEPVGVVGVADISRVPREDRDVVPVGRVARSAAALPTVAPEEEVVDVLDRLRSEDVLAVRDGDGRLVGLLTRSQLLRALERTRRLHQDDRQRGRRPRAHLPGDRG